MLSSIARSASSGTLKIVKTKDKNKVLKIINKKITVPILAITQGYKIAQKIETQEANLRFHKLLDQDFTMTAQVVYHKSLDVEFKKKLQNSLGLMPANPVEVQNFLSQSDGAFTGDEPKRIFNDICFFKRNTTLNLQDSIQKVVNSDKKDIQAEKNQINRHKRRKALRQDIESIVMIEEGLEG